MIDKFVRVAVAGVQVARSSLASCVFKSKPTKKLCRKGLSVALLGVSALSMSHMASATPITVDADVVANTGWTVAFTPFDQGLGTLTGAHLTYSFAVTYNFRNDWGLIAASDWQSNAVIRVTDKLGSWIAPLAGGSEAHGAIPELGSDEDASAWVTISGEAELAAATVVDPFWLRAYYYLPTVGGGAEMGDSITVPWNAAEGAVFNARVTYSYEAAAAGPISTVPSPPTIALFTLGLMVIAARRVKARKYR